MGKYLDKFRGGKEKLEVGADKLSAHMAERQKYQGNYNRRKIRPNSDKRIGSAFEHDGIDENFDDEYMDYEDDSGFHVQPAQKPESFHHFILENQYKDLEKSIRGYKDVWDKETQTWKTKRKDTHCFTDEEAEDILRMAQSHLATDIKLSYIRQESFGIYMDALYKQIARMFKEIAEYRYGRYGSYEKQFAMKMQNLKIFIELFSRIQANYSRAIQGAENKATHGSVKGQESLQSGDRDLTGKNRGYF